MIDISKAKIAFKKFLDKYKDKSDLSFQLKVVHTYHVAENSKYIAEKLNLSKEDIESALAAGNKAGARATQFKGAVKI